MDFRIATDRAIAGITLGEIAAEIGVAENTVNRARMARANPNARSAPPGWERAVVKLARARAAELLGLAKEIEGK